MSILLHATRIVFKPLSLHIDLTFNPYLREIWQKYAKMTFVHDRIFTFDFGRFKITQYAVKVA